MRLVTALAFALCLLAGPSFAADPPPAGVTVVHGTETPLTEADLEQLPATPVKIHFDTEHGPEDAAFEGPLLWAVLGRADALDSAKPRAQVRQTVLVTGRDGYSAVLALAEISPAFEGKQVVLALRMNGTPLGPEHLRIVVPGDQHGGRAVRDVVRIELR